MFSKLKKHALLICIFLLTFFVWQTFSVNSKLQEYKNQVIKLKDGEQLFIEKLNEKGERIAEQDQVILSQKDAIAYNLLEIENLKKIKSQVKITTITKIDSVYVPVLDTIERIVYDTTGLALLKLPTKFGLENEWYSIYSTINKNGMLLDSLSLYNRQIITLGMKSNGFLKAPTPSVVVKNENPYVSVNSLNNVVIKNDTRFYDKKVFWFGFGLGTGVLIPLLVK
jgi:regulatory protein YycH of two-component signal transduction system YycFG